MSYNSINLNLPNQPYLNNNESNLGVIDPSNMDPNMDRNKIPMTNTNDNTNMETNMNQSINNENNMPVTNPARLDNSVVDVLKLPHDTLQPQLIGTSNPIVENNGPLTVSTTFSSTKTPSNEFVRKLFNILENNAYPEIVRWGDTGDSFVVIDTGKFTANILPNHFKHSNFASFVRQLNKYDFHKVKRKPDERSKYGDLSWEFKHPIFRIHNEAGLENIKRKITVPKKDTENANVISISQLNPNITNASTTNDMLTTKTRNSMLQNFVSKESFNNLKTKVSRLENELKMSQEESSTMKLEAERINTKYTTLLESLITFRTVHENLSNNFNSLCSILVNRGIDIPQNIYNNVLTNKAPQFSPPNEMTLNNPISDPSSTSPSQHLHPQALMNNINNQFPLLNTSNNEMLMSLQPDQKSRLNTSDNNSPNTGNSITTTSGQPTVDNSNMINPNNTTSTNDNTINMTNMNNNNKNNENDTTDSIKNENTASNVNNSNNTNPNVNNNIPPNASDVTLRKGFHVLLVEDDAVSIQLCSRFLRKYGCTVEVVTDGLSAISTLEKFRYDLVLMDIVMPNLDGATATSIVRSFDNQTPIIAMTGNIEDQDLLTYLQHGMNDILAKPFTRNDLHSMLVRYLKDRIPLCEQKQPPPSLSNDNSANPQLSPNMLQATPNMGNTAQLQPNVSISPTLSNSIIQPPASIDANTSTPQLINQTQSESQPHSRNSSTFEENEPASKKQRI